MTTLDDPLMARANALKLYGLLAHWPEVAASDWIEALIRWEEQERARRSLERRLGNAKLGRFKPLADFDWEWPTHLDLTIFPRSRSLRLWGSETGCCHPKVPALTRKWTQMLAA